MGERFTVCLNYELSIVRREVGYCDRLIITELLSKLEINTAVTVRPMLSVKGGQKRYVVVIGYDTVFCVTFLLVWNLNVVHYGAF